MCGTLFARKGNNERMNIVPTPNCKSKIAFHAAYGRLLFFVLLYYVVELVMHLKVTRRP